MQRSVRDFAVNLYLDGTPSMEGFVANPNSQYIQWVSDLLDRFRTTQSIGFDGRPHSLTNLQYFRLGTQNQSDHKRISDDEALRFQTPEFYNGKNRKFPLLNVSEIDTAIAEPDTPNELTVIVTDLYQAEDNLARVTSQVKSYLTANNSSYGLGVIGIKSEFQGTVYPEGLRSSGKFPYDSKEVASRPFYILFLGQIDEINFYFKELLKDKSLTEETVRAVIFSPFRVYEKPASLEPMKQEDLTKLPIEVRKQQKLSVPGYSTKFGNVVVTISDPHVQALRIDSRSSTDFKLTAKATLAPIKYLPILKPSAFKATVISKIFDRKKKQFTETHQQPALAQALNFSGWEQLENTLQFSVQVQPQNIQGSGLYFFETQVVVSPDRGEDALESQDWWNDWSSNSNERRGDKTHNLKKFMDSLERITTEIMQQNQPVVGRFCYLIQKG